MLQELEKDVPIDPRTGIFILFAANIAIFLNKSIYVEIAIIVLLAVLLVYSKCEITALKWIICFAGLLILQYYIIPMLPEVIENLILFMPIFFRKFFPCLMAASLMIKRIPAKYLVTAMQKCKIPWKIIVPLSITLRYFPTVKREIKYIKDAMKLRNINRIKKLEGIIVSVIVLAAAASDELSAAAVTRGIENPCAKTSYIVLRFKVIDYVCIFIGLAFVLAIFIF